MYRTALTTTPQRSFSGPSIAQFASTLLVCAGLLLLLRAPVSSDRGTPGESGTTVCAGSPDAPRDRQWTDGAAVNAPDSCDDEDGDDEDGDDTSSSGSGQAISDGLRSPAVLDEASELVREYVASRVRRPLDAHTVRGPPDGPQEPCDVDVDDDDDDDDPSANDSAPLLAANRRAPHLLSSVHCFRSASVDCGSALRAPPQ
jgi:hypothetical protein